MSALAKPNFRSLSAKNPFTIVNADLVSDIQKLDALNPSDPTANLYEIHFHYVQPYTSIIKWRYLTQSARDTAFTAIVTAIATSST
jgi:hypothetical protein